MRRTLVLFCGLVMCALLAGALLVPAGAVSGCDANFPNPVVGVDQQAAIQAVIDAAPDGTTGDQTVLCFPGPKNGVVPSYRVEGMVKVYDRAFLKFKNEATWNRTALIGDTDPTAKVAWAPQLQIRTSHDISFPVPSLNLNSVGDGSFVSAYEGEAAVYVKGSVNVDIHGFDIFGPAGDGYELGWYQPQGQAAIPSDNVDITGGTVTKVGRQGVGVTSSLYHSSVTGVTFDDASRSTLDMEMAGTPPCTGLLIDDFTFSGNTALDVAVNFVAGGGCGTHQNVTISGNTAETLKGKYGSTDGVIHRYNIVFSGNVGTVPHAGGTTLLIFRAIDGITVTNNTQSASVPTGYTDCLNITESGNNWT